MVEVKKTCDIEKADVDIFRDTALRYLALVNCCWSYKGFGVVLSSFRFVSMVVVIPVSPGYANEVGEAFRTHIPRLMYLGSYGIASTYCLVDSVHKGHCCYQESAHLSSYIQRRRAVETAVEAVIWQGLASVIIPGFAINRICAVSRFTLWRVARSIPPARQVWLTTVIGLGAIPVIIKPIDRLVDHLMDGMINISRRLGISHQLDHTHNRDGHFD